MQSLPIGEVIRQKRLALGLSQEEVCDGICEPATLSRIENGRQTPSRSRLNALLQRLDLPEDRYYALVSRDEAEIEALKKEIVACNARARVNEGFRLLEQLERKIEPDDILSKQFVLRSKALLGWRDGRYSSEQLLELLMQAILLTVPKFDLEEIGRGLYTFDEVKIINLMASVYSRMGNNKKATDILYQLLKYVRKHFHEVLPSNGMFPMILSNYARVLDLCGRYEEGADYAEQCRKACIQYGHYQFLTTCLGIYAECCHFLGRERESAEAYIKSYVLMSVLDDYLNIETLRKEFKKYHGADIETVLKF